MSYKLWYFYSSVKETICWLQYIPIRYQYGGQKNASFMNRADKKNTGYIYF